MNVAIMGASNKPSRYSYKAVMLLAEEGHAPFPIHPFLEDIDGIRVYAKLSDIKESIDTITVYLSAANSANVAETQSAGNWVRSMRAKLQNKGVLVPDGPVLRFTEDHVFLLPVARLQSSLAASRTDGRRGRTKMARLWMS